MKRLGKLMRRRRLEAGLVLGLVLLLLVVGVLAQGYRDGQKQRDNLGKRVNEEKRAVTILQDYESLVEPTKEELIRVNALLAQAQSRLPGKVDELGVVSLLVEAALKSNVELSNFQLGEEGLETLAVNPYRVVRYGVVAQGQLSYLAVFLSHIEGGASTRAENVVLTPATGVKYKMTFQLVVLGRQD